MAQLELNLDALRVHTSTIEEPQDYDHFWRQTLAHARRFDSRPTFVAAPTPLRLVDSFDVSFPGFGGQTVRGWLHLPVGRPGTLPCVIQYMGYGGGRGLVHQNTFWAAAGYAHFVMDTRGQGSSWSTGVTPDKHDGAPEYPGFVTRGVLDPETYFYRRLFTDAVRAVDALRGHPRIDSDRIAVTGVSQGGAMALAVAALVGDLVAALPDVPFMCDVRRACSVTDQMPYAEIVRYLKTHRDHVDQVFSTLSYFDGTVLARHARTPALFSVALMDVICPPSTVYAAFNAYGGAKQIREYAYNDHEGGGPFHEVVQATWLSQFLDG